MRGMSRSKPQPRFPAGSPRMQVYPCRFIQVALAVLLSLQLVSCLQDRLAHEAGSPCNHKQLCGSGLRCVEGTCVECEQTEQSCDGLDEDCDGQTDEELTPPSGLCLDQGVCAGTMPVCEGEPGWRCHYSDDYEEKESICDGLDNDCDGETNEGCVCVVGDTRSCGKNEGVCREGVQHCLRFGWGACSGRGPEEEEESICDGLDNDCDGETDEGLTPPSDLCTDKGVCADTLPTCEGKTGWRCHYLPIYEEDEATCDGMDNDCDGRTDENLTPPFYLCLDHGVCAGTMPVCEGAPGWTCHYPDTHHEETCQDSLDNDCDGETDEGC